MNRMLCALLAVLATALFCFAARAGDPRGGAKPGDLIITTTSLPNGVVGQPYSATIQAKGGVPPYSWSLLAGSLPAGLSLKPSTGVIYGTPAAAGRWDFTIGVSDSQNPPDTDQKALSTTIDPPADLVITTTSLPDGVVGKPYSATLQAKGGIPPYSWSLSAGSLPTGLSLNGATGVISGTPGMAGRWDFTVMVSDSQNPPDTAEKALSITITDP